MDDLLDLTWSEKSTPPQRSAGGTATPPSTAFDLLSRPPRAGPNYSSTSTPRTSSPIPASAPSSQAGLASRAAPHASGSLTPRLGSILNPTSRSGTPAQTGSARASPPPQSQSQSQSRTAGSSSGADAFSALLGGGVGNSASSGQMTMAQRRAQLASERAAREEHERNLYAGDDSFWSQLGGTESAKPLAPAVAPAPASAPLAAPVAAPAKTPAPVVAPAPAPAKALSKSTAGAFWDDEFLSAPSPSPSLSATPAIASTTAQAKRPASAAPSVSSKPTSKPASVAPTPPPVSQAPADPWDFDALAAAAPMASSSARVDYSSDVADDTDNLLGELGRPARRKSPKPRSKPTTPPDRADSPPPHIVGQIVEMGFSPAQARAALAATGTGLDVEAAIDSLLNGPGNGHANTHGDDDDGLGHELEMDDERIAREMQAREDREAEAEAERRRQRHAARRAGPSRDSLRAAGGRGGAGQGQGNGHESNDEDGLNREQLMTQASEIGASMLSTATSFWNQGKARALKMYEEQKRALEAQQSASRRAAPTDGRPRWMVDAEEAEREQKEAADRAEREYREAAAAAGLQEHGGRDRREERRGLAGNGFSHGDASGFRDDDDMPPPASQPRPKVKAPAEARSNLSVKERADLLFAEEPKRYVSKNRHFKGRGAVAASASPVAVAPATPPAPLPERELVHASAQQTANAAKHRTAGNEHFKLGRFSEAEASYSSAIASLPTGCLLVVPLHNNRAAALLKLGEAQRSAEDSTTVIELIGANYHPSKEAPLPAAFAEVRLGEALAKATAKRAQAHEMVEKWGPALADWERLLGFDTAVLGAGGVATKGQASEGVRRTKKMLAGDTGSSAPSGSSAPARPKPATRAPPRPAAPSKPADPSASAGVQRLRAAAAAAEAEDTQRLALKDGVDAKLASWRDGKETNLRALIASLDTVLWPEILAGGAKVGMHELVTDKQVKVKYMRVVARLHPDKLSSANLSVEQKMLANGVFGTLSEAWAAFNSK